jgi:hypothetical protein
MFKSNGQSGRGSHQTDQAATGALPRNHSESPGEDWLNLGVTTSNGSGDAPNRCISLDIGFLRRHIDTSRRGTQTNKPPFYLYGKSAETAGTSKWNLIRNTSISARRPT